MNKWSAVISAATLLVSATGFACGPTGSASSTTTTGTSTQFQYYQRPLIEPQLIQRRLVIESPHGPVSQRTRDFDDTYFALRKKLSNMSNSELRTLNSLLKDEIGRRRH